MVSLLLPIIYIAFISLGLPESLLGSAWPTMYPELGVPVSCAGILSMIISLGTILSSLQSDRLTRTLGTGRVTAIMVPGPCRFLGLFGRDSDYIIPWGCIRRIGEDIILVEGPISSWRVMRKKKGLF